MRRATTGAANCEAAPSRPVQKKNTPAWASEKPKRSSSHSDISELTISPPVAKADTFGVKIRGAASIRQFLTHPDGLRAIRRFNLTHMNRGRNAYQASHCYSVADHMLEG